MAASGLTKGAFYHHFDSKEELALACFRYKQEELVQRATLRLAEFAEGLGIGRAPRQVTAGNIKAEIVRAAQEQKADLIVLGCRERRGPSILVNFTEDTVLHAAPCDVLAVRLR